MGRPPVTGIDGPIDRGIRVSDEVVRCSGPPYESERARWPSERTRRHQIEIAIPHPRYRLFGHQLGNFAGPVRQNTSRCQRKPLERAPAHDAQRPSCRGARLIAAAPLGALPAVVRQVSHALRTKDAFEL